MAKARTSTKSKTKAEVLQEAVAEAVGAGKELHLESVDFSNPNRPKTCLEVDFPILPINHVAAIEGNAGKPIYQMSKWWARRRSSVFRAMLIAAATKAPEDPADAAKLVWDSYYGNHQRNEAFQKLKVADIFMGGGTTIVEGSRLGMQMIGNDLNPVAWLVVKNEMAEIDPGSVQKLLDEIETAVKPQIMPFYACHCPRGHKGKWKHKATSTVMEDGFDPTRLKSNEREEYKYEGPEVIYTFWAKHGPCQATECSHRTPIMSSPVIAVKSLTVKAWLDKTCRSCNMAFDLENREAHIAPSAITVVAETEKPYAVIDEDGYYSCPHCKAQSRDEKAASTGVSIALGKSSNKKINFSLLIHPDWLKGASGKDKDGTPLGGCVDDTFDSTKAWMELRASTLKLIEVRGTLPDEIRVPGLGIMSTAIGTIPRKSVFACQESTCGVESNVLKAINKSGKTAPIAAYAIQGHCPVCEAEGYPYGGRFFSVPDTALILEAENELNRVLEKKDFNYLPSTDVPEGLETSVRTPLAKYHYKSWKHFFNARQLLCHELLLSAVNRVASDDSCSLGVLLAAFQQFLRNQNMFCIWNINRDTNEPFLSKNNLQPPPRTVENNVFNDLGRGNWKSSTSNLVDALLWRDNPWELVPYEELKRHDGLQESDSVTGKSLKVFPGDPVVKRVNLSCGSSTSLTHVASGSVDLVITDPPFGDIMQYAELSDFFYCWLRPFADKLGCNSFNAEHPPIALEAVDNYHRHGKNGASFYQRLLSECWREAARILKASGILAFTFHHDKDEPWVAVLESLFDAGFILEAALPVRSDETKGEGSTPGTFGAQKVEFDIIHVCRKRAKEPESISWARLRRQILKDVQQLQDIIEQHQKEGLGEADLQVIRRGKALEYYSRHYGKVYIEKGREDEFTVKDALVGINQLLDDETDSTTERPPELAEPYTRQFLRLFANKISLDRDQIQKYLRGTGVSPSEFVDRGWCTEEKKIFTIADPMSWAQDWKGKSRRTMARDFDQAYFLIGASYENSGIKVSDTLNSESFVPHPALGDLLAWFVKHSPTEEMRSAARRAQQLYSAWQAKNTKVAVIQRTLFDLEE